VLEGERRHERLQQLGLARAGGAADQRVRAVRAQVDRQVLVAGRADRRGERPLVVGLPAPDDLVRRVLVLVEQLEQGDA
jgi:hypothetical protein